jgi:hypothetical protein
VLVNGDFHDGLRGWQTSGDAANFSVIDASDANARAYATTWLGAPDDANGDSLEGVLSQSFVVPKDALALRFWIFGGHAHVRLRNAASMVIEDVVGRDENTVRVPVSWDLRTRRGEKLALAIEDDSNMKGFNFVSVTGFDVIREDSGPLVNSQFDQGLMGWQMSGDAAHFDVFDDYDYVLVNGNTSSNVPAYGTRHSVSSYVRDTAATVQAESATGTLSQTFVVPVDAIALRFNVHGGKLGRVSLYDGATMLNAASGVEDNAQKLPVSWDLVAHRGKMLKLAIEDTVTGSWGYIGASGFDLITAFNGP